MKNVLLTVPLTVLATLGVSAHADLKEGSCSNAQKAKVVTEHSAMIGGNAVDYTATAGFMEVVAADQKSKACIFYTAYESKARPAAQRPVIFAFNGGPGSSSVWLHLGLLGPKRVDMGADGLHPPSSPALIANQFSMLDIADIVMIDPVATGFSHAEGKAKNDAFFGVRNDYTAVAEFVRNYLIEYKRWLSPKFLMGESYGGIRGSLLADYLQSNMNIRVDGLILISPALSRTTFFSKSDNLIPYVTYFPSFAATAWYHKRIDAKYGSLTVDEVYNVAKKFADTRLLGGLMLGGVLSAADRENLAQEVAEFLGTSKAEVLGRDLRITDDFFYNGFFADSRRTTGRYDSRFTELNVAENTGDPSGEAPALAYAAGVNDYLRTELGVQTPSPYNLLGHITSWPDESGGWDVMPSVSHALRSNPRFSVYIASGYFDFACPMETVAYEIRQMPMSSLLKDRIQQDRYFGGHMMYLNPDALQQLKANIGQFVLRQSAAVEGVSAYLAGAVQ
ncbi:MAG: hypothetical protein C5B49_15080 [Bdellovibrio sp.]|nr:MAG: hypothetical protein C5B49_15080 [Bdellovibrio sp.]